jgi:hypothetical protein
MDTSKTVKKAEKKVARALARKAVSNANNQLQQKVRAQILQGSKMKNMHSSYLLAILDPESHGQGAKIPDLVTVPSQATTNKFKLTQTSGSAGSGVALAVAVGCPAAQYQTGTITSGVITWTSLWTAAPWAGVGQNTFQAMRAVSAILKAQVQGSTNNNQGRLVYAYYPVSTIYRSSFSAVTLPPTTTALIENSMLGASHNVASGGNACEVRYIPTDIGATQYVPYPPSSVTNPFSGNPAAAAGLLVIACEALQAGVNSEFYFTENDECLPLNTNTSVAATTPSRSDPLEMSHVANTLASNQQLATAQTPSIRVGQMQSNVKIPANQNEPSFGDKLLGIAEKGWEIGKKVAPVAGALLALL